MVHDNTAARLICGVSGKSLSVHVERVGGQYANLINCQLRSGRDVLPETDTSRSLGPRPAGQDLAAVRDAESAELARVRIPSWLRWSKELPVPPSAVTEDLRDVCFPSTLSNYSDSSLSCRIGPETVDLLDKLLVCNPRERLTASQALDHDYFWTDPLPADPKTWVSCLVPRESGDDLYPRN